MKKALFLSLLASLLYADNTDHTFIENDSPPFSAPVPSQDLTHGYSFRPLPNEGSFPFFSLGLSTKAAPPILQNTQPSFSFGKRFLFGHFGFDTSLGARLSEYSQTYYLQTSYLLYPFQPNGLYLGFGLEAGLQHTPSHPLAFRFELPLSFGYQFASSERRSFVQLQALPLSTPNKYPALTLNYGFGF